MLHEYELSKSRGAYANNEKLICNSFILDITRKYFMFIYYMVKALIWGRKRVGEERNLWNCWFMNSCEMCYSNLI